MKTAILFAAGIATYGLLVFVQPTAWVSVLLCVLMGVTLAAVGFNVMHDGAHGSYSTRKWVNNMMSFSLEIMGGSSYMWKIKHNVIHHTYTNIEGEDDDIDIAPWIRTNTNQPRYWYHRFQHLYSMILYGMTYLIWIFQGDFTKYFTKKISGKKIRKMKFGDHFIFWLSKVMYLGCFIVLPGLLIGWIPTIVGYAITAGVCGIILSIVFQLAHIVQETEFPMPAEETNKMETEWALHQLATTGNFATKNKLVSWYVGGLNYQVEHHLFPKISHIHYPALNEILKETCTEFDVKYVEYPTVRSALVSHLRHLKVVGRT